VTKENKKRTLTINHSFMPIEIHISSYLYISELVFLIRRLLTMRQNFVEVMIILSFIQKPVYTIQSMEDFHVKPKWHGMIILTLFPQRERERECWETLRIILDTCWSSRVTTDASFSHVKMPHVQPSFYPFLRPLTEKNSFIVNG